MPGGNQLHGGTLADFDSADNMAKEIENAYKAVRILAGITDPLPSGPRANDMRMMFIAIATGVINHLKNNPAAFAVEVTGDLVNQVNGNLLTSDGNVTAVSVTP
jgi:hypothetical protein